MRQRVLFPLRNKRPLRTEAAVLMMARCRRLPYATSPMSWRRIHRALGPAERALPSTTAAMFNRPKLLAVRPAARKNSRTAAAGLAPVARHFLFWFLSTGAGPAPVAVVASSGQVPPNKILSLRLVAVGRVSYIEVVWWNLDRKSTSLQGAK